jgi:hypothetical protein
MYKDKVLDLQQKCPNWRDAWEVLPEEWGKNDGKLVHGPDVLVSGAYVYIGLLHGGGDFWRIMNIPMHCGVD